MIGKRAYHMAKCKKKFPNYRSSLILCVVIEELRVVKGLVAYGLGPINLSLLGSKVARGPEKSFFFFFLVHKCPKYACVLYVHSCDR